jgi:hypothetical protein
MYKNKDNNLKLSLELSSSDSEYNKNENKKPPLNSSLRKKNEQKQQDSDEDEEDFSIEISGRKNKTMFIENKNIKNSSDSDTRTKSSLKKSNDKTSSSSESRSPSTTRTKSRTSSRLDSRKKKVSFSRSSSTSSCSSCSTDSSSTPTSSSRKKTSNVKRKSRERRIEEVKKEVHEKLNKQRSASNSPTISSLASSVDESNLNLSPIKVFIDKKPPIDKTNLKLKHHRRSPSLEKPSDSEIVNSSITTKSIKDKKSKKKAYIDDYNSSGAEMTDVSPLPSPLQPKVSITPKSKSSTIDDLDRLKIMKFNEVFDMRDLMKSIDDKIEKYTQRSHNSQRSIENLSAKSDIRNVQNTNTLRFLSNSQFLDSDSELFRNIESRNTTTSSVLKKKKKNKDKVSSEKAIRVTSSALNRMKEQQRIEKENRVNTLICLCSL